LAQDTLLLNDAFTIEVHENICDQHLVMFDMTIEGESKETWNSTFGMILNAPKLIVSNFTIDDTQAGDGNGRLDPGETLDLIYETKNDGHAKIESILAELLCETEGITLNSSSFEIETLDIGQAEQIVFNISVGADVAIGTTVTFDFIAESGFYNAQDHLSTAVGLILEDWETGDFSKFNWTFGGNQFWSICEDAPFEGEYCSQSGTIFDQQTTSFNIDYVAANDDSLSFYYKVSCEDDPYGTGYDFLSFSIDGNEMGKWDGTIEWTKQSYAVTEGEHTFSWVYSKDYSESAGDDCAWVDFIVFPAARYYVGINENAGDKSGFNIYPNPASGQVKLDFKLEEASNLSCKLYNSMGQLKRILLENVKTNESAFSLSFDSKNIDNGIYFCELTINNIKYIKKLIIAN
jgi:type IX secretion system substrate protein